MPDSEENILEHCLDLVKSNNADMDTIQMRDALAAIADEVQRFRCNSNDNFMGDIDSYKNKLKSKKKKIKALKDNLNTACIIAKTVISAKESESVTLNKRLTLAKDESQKLLQKNIESAEFIQRLTNENRTLTEKLKNLSNFIELGYEEMEKIRGEIIKDIPTELQLKEIMVCCGQYYADYCNEREKRTQLEQRNRYLSNKLHILETNLDAVSNELNKYKNQKSYEKNKNTYGQKAAIKKLKITDSAFKHKIPINVSRVSVQTNSNDKEDNECNSLSKTESLDLSSHISLVNNLLTDQDSMLKDLKKLAEELNVSPP